MRIYHGLTGTAVKCKTADPPFSWRTALLEGPCGWWNSTAFGINPVRGWGVGSGAPGEDLSLAYLGFGINEAHSMLIDGN